MALLEKYPEKFVVNVFPTRRSCAYPGFIYEATAKNARTAKVIEQGYGFSGASAGFPSLNRRMPSKFCLTTRRDTLA